MTTASTRANPQAVHEALTTGNSSLLPIGFMETFRHHFSDDQSCHSHAMGMCEASSLGVRCAECILAVGHRAFTHEETMRFIFGDTTPNGKLKLRRLE